MTTPKKMRAALREALELFAHEATHNDGTLIVNHTTGMPYGSDGQWVMQAREALGLDPLTGKRRPRAASVASAALARPGGEEGNQDG